MSASVGAIRIAKLERLLHDLLHGRQRVELSPLHLVQQAPQLRIVRDSPLEMSFGATGCDGEPLTSQILAPTRLELPLRLQMRTVRLDLLPELSHVLSGRRLCQHDGRLPG